MEECLGVIMRKLALLLAAALVVSAPLVAAISTDTYAAAKKAKKAAKAPAAPKEVSPEDANTRFFRALDDLGRQLSTYVYVYQPGDAGKAGKAGGKKSGGGKKGKKG